MERSLDGRRAIAEMLAASGIVHDAVDDLQGAAEMLFGQTHDLVVAAADLPDGSVLELIYLARQAPTRPLVIVVGKRPSREAWCRFVAAGAHHYVVGAELFAVIGHVALRGTRCADDLALLDRIAQDCSGSPPALRWLAMSVVLRSRRHEELGVVDLSLVVRDVIALLDHAFPPNIQVAAELSERHVMGARGELELLVASLLTNAIDAMPEGGACSVRVRAYGFSTVLEVIDDGAPPPGWLGLGLAHRVLERHRGVLRLAPHGVRGTAVTVLLPSRS